MDYAAEIERIGAENRRRMSMLMDELNEAKLQTERNAQACAEWFAAEASRERSEREQAARSAADEERERRAAEAREQQEAAAARREAQARQQHAAPRTTPVRRANDPAIQQHYEQPRESPEPTGPLTEAERREAELREQRAAIARAAAFRKANDVVRPVDDEDEDDEYYRRKSWLV
ncbi:hypothetical protein [Nocardia miyunensis]|uniref:hypothetical protein n=1 Tax=Nocardia miyunensis TaxID=282684 RepID=UPI000833358C|nr:hypothetical protein [Nocardia miyunensis]